MRGHSGSLIMVCFRPHPYIRSGGRICLGWTPATPHPWPQMQDCLKAYACTPAPQTSVDGFDEDENTTRRQRQRAVSDENSALSSPRKMTSEQQADLALVYRQCRTCQLDPVNRSLRSAGRRRRRLRLGSERRVSRPGRARSLVSRRQIRRFLRSTGVYPQGAGPDDARPGPRDQLVE